MPNRFFRLILLLYPEWIRARYGGEMLRLFRDSLREAEGRWARAGVFLHTSIDGLKSGLGLRWEMRRSRLASREVRKFGMGSLAQDCRHALRSYARRPGLTLIAVVTLAIGIGGNTLIFSVVDAVLLRPLPYGDPDRVVMLTRHFVSENGTFESFAFSEPAFLTLQEVNQTFDLLAAFTVFPTAAGGAVAPFQTTGLRASSGIWSILGVRPHLGRTFQASDDRPGAQPVTLISHRLWASRYGSDPSVLGGTLEIGTTPHTIIGVLPTGFSFFSDAIDLWIPLATDPSDWADNASINNNRSILGLLPATVTIEPRESMAGMHRSAVERSPDAFPNPDNGELLYAPIRETQIGSVEGTLLTLFGAVFFVLLIACANLANLLLVQAEGRRAEFAVRAALGAGRRRVFRQLITESVLLAGLGATVGLGIAFVGLGTVKALAPSSILRLDTATLSAGVLLFTALLAGFTGVLFGLAPAVSTLRSDLRSVLGGSSSSGGGRVGARAALVVSEVAITVVLMVGAGLLVNSLLRLEEVDLGFETEGRTMVAMRLPGGVYVEDEEWTALLDRMLLRIEGLPGVTRAAYAFSAPMQFQSNWFVEIENRVEEDRRFIDYNLVTPGYFETMGIPLLDGRSFDVGESMGGRQAIVVSRSMARALFPDADAVGKRVNLNMPPDRVWREIVGVVGDVRTGSVAWTPQPQMYLPAVKHPFADPGLGGTLVVERDENAGEVAGSLRNVVGQIEPRAALGSIVEVGAAVVGAEAERRFVAWLLMSFAGVALLLSLMGLYGVIAHTVALRTRELGLRIALGASRDSLLRAVVRQGAAMAGAGAALGLLGSVFTTRLLSRLLFEVTPLDPLTYGVVAVILAVVALATTVVPARRATRIDPTEALRYE